MKFNLSHMSFESSWLWDFRLLITFVHLRPPWLIGLGAKPLVNAIFKGILAFLPHFPTPNVYFSHKNYKIIIFWLTKWQKSHMQLINESFGNLWHFDITLHLVPLLNTFWGSVQSHITGILIYDYVSCCFPQIIPSGFI